MFAVFEIGCNQYKVFKGDKLKIEKINAKEGSNTSFKQVLLMVDDDGNLEIGAPFVDFQIDVKVLSHGRGEKIRVVKHKSKKRYHKVQGHRQSFTEIEVLDIKKASGSKKAAPKKETAERKEEENKKKEAEIKEEK